MADYPCDFHLARYSGPSTRCFLNLYREDQVVQLRASVCPSDLESIVAVWLPRSLVKTPEGYWDPMDEAAELQGLWQAQESPARQRNGSRRY